MTSTAPVGAEWALYGKRPGSSSDFRVIAAGGEVLKPAHFDRIIVAFSPGNPPPMGTVSPAALPWVSFTAIALEGRDYLVVLVRDWTDVQDSANRPVAFTSCYCLPFDALGGRSLRFTDLHAAALSCPLEWEVPDPFGGDAIGLALPPALPPEEIPLETLGVPQAMTAAATVSEQRPVALLRPPASLATRLAVLDAVPPLLPAGARRWLSASTWAESNAKHRFQFAFTQRARENDQRIELGIEPDPLPPGAALSYYDELVRLFSVKRRSAVVSHLGKLGTTRSREPTVLLDALSELDLPGAVVRAAHNRSLRSAQVRRLNELDRVRELESESDHLLVFGADLDVSSAQDLRTDADLWARHWREAFGPRLGTLARARLWREGWSVEDLAVLSEFASERRCLPELVAQLAPASDDRQPPAARCTVAVQWIEGLDRDYPVRAELATAVAGHRALAVAVLRHMLRLSRADDAASWVRRLDEAASRARLPWSDIAEPFRIALCGAVGELDSYQLGMLDGIDPEIVPALAVHLANQRQTRSESFMRRTFRLFMDLFQRIGQAMTRFENWIAGLDDLAGDDPVLRAELDVETYLAGRRPRRGLLQSLFVGERVQREYFEAFVGASRAAARAPDEVPTLLAGVVAQLPAGWSAPTGRFVAVLELLRALGDERLRGQRLSTDHVLDAVVQEVATRGELIDLPEFQPWYTEIENHRPELMGSLLRAQLANLRPDETVENVGAAVARALRAGSAVAEVIAEMRRSAFRPTVEQLVPLTLDVADDLRAKPPRRSNAPRPHDFGIHLTQDVLAGGFGPDRASVARERLPETVLRQIFAHFAVLYAAATSDETTVEILRARIPHLQQLQQNLKDIVEALERSGRQGRSVISPVLSWFGIDTAAEHRHGHL